MKTEDYTKILFNDFSNLSTQILRIANRGASKLEFLREVFTLLAHFSSCDAIGLLLKEEGHINQWDALLQSGGELLFSKNEYKKNASNEYIAYSKPHKNIVGMIRNEATLINSP